METVLNRFLCNARRIPDNMAIWADEKSFTYGELLSYAKRIAHVLQNDGVRKGDAVTIELPRCREYIGAIMGIWMVGGVFVPSDNTYPEDRKSYIAKDCSAKVRLDTDYLGKIGVEEHDCGFPAFQPDDVAFITYTSGSTGMPKGVIFNHRAVSASVARIDSAWILDEGDRFASPSSFTFIAWTVPMLSFICRGIPVYAIPDAARYNMVKLSEFTAGHSITHMFMAPAMVPYVKQHEKTLKCIFVAGERASNVYSDEFKVVNNYGATECGSLITYFDIDKPYASTPLGKTPPGLNLYLLDDQGAEAEEGEICITGDIASGYCNMPEATDKVFVKNPFADTDGCSTMYRTGDIGRRMPDGSIIFLERRDWMVNINGQRVEPAEISAALTSLPQIVQAVVKDFEGSDGQTFLCAYYRTVTPISEDEIRQHLESCLPRYMIPAHLVRMEAMTLNQNGKIDRSMLPDPCVLQNEAVTPSEHPYPDNRIVRSIRKALESVTGKGDYGYDADLMKCGLSSLSMIRFASCIMEDIGANLNVYDMLSGCSIRSVEGCIVDSLMNRCEAGGEHKEIPLKTKYPLTKTQIRVFSECDADPESVTYNIPFSMDFPKADGTDVVTVKSAIETVINAHFPLKSTISADEDGIPSMYPHRDAPVSIVMQSGSEEEYEAVKTAFVRPFVLSESLYRVTVFETDTAVRCLFDFHHLMFDGSSAVLFREELSNAVKGKVPEPEFYTMFDVSEEESEAECTPRYDKAGEYFGELLSGVEGTTVLLGDVPKGQRSKGQVTRQCELLGRSEVGRFVASQNVSEDAFFLSVMGYTLSRFTYSDEVCFTTVHSGRGEGRTNRMMGMLVKTVPAVCRIASPQTPEDLVKGMYSQSVETRRNSIYPFTQISTRLGVSTDVMFAFQAIFDQSLIDDSLALDDIKNQLLVQVFPSDEGYMLDVVFDKAVYSEGFIDSFADAFVLAARGFLSCPDLGRISVLGRDSELLLDSFNATELDYDRSATVVSIFRKIVSEYPEKTAVVCDGTSLTFREFDEVTDRLASYIQREGLGKECYIGILTSRNINGFIAPWGVAKAGAACLPLDPSYPSERLEYMILDSSASMLIVDRQLTDDSERIRSLVENFRGKVLFTDEFDSLLEGKISAGPSPEDASVILYTSGTTGKPKGCVIEHAQMTAYLQTSRERFGYSPEARLAQYASFGFDIGFTEIFLPMVCGTTVYVINEAIRSDMKAMEKFYRDNEITVGFMTTQVGRLFIENTDIPTLRNFLLGGEKLVPVNPPENVCFTDLYGPSETLVFVASHRCLDDTPMQPVGIPNHNTRFYVVDRELNRLPPGAAGELCIAGLQVSRGYLNNPAKTAETFISNPFSSEPDYSRIYRTGDVARIRPDGNLDIIGRNDGQVKIRGFRVELTEVEKAVRGFPGIKDATIQAFDSPGGGKYLAAYVVSDSHVNSAELNDFILANKPAYMVPAVTIQLDSIPLTVNGKVDRRGLPAPNFGSCEIMKPVTDMHRRIHATISKVIGTDEFGIDTDLFAAGLTSISIIRLNVLLSEEFGITFQSRDIKDNPSVIKLGEFIGRSGPVESYPVQDDYPLTCTQEGIFVDCVSHPGSTAYNIPMLIALDPSLVIGRLKASIVKAVDAHPYVMTSLFQNEDGDVRLRHTVPGMFTESDIEEIACDGLDGNTGSLIKPFDIFGPRLFRVGIIHADKDYLLLDIHHIICDGTSMRILLDTISRIYAGEDVPSESFSGFEASLAEQAGRASDRLGASRNYFETLLSGYDRDFLPKGDVYHPDPDAQKFQIIEGKPGLAEKVSGFCRKTKVGINGIMCGAFGYVLSGYSGSDHSVFTTVYNGRNDSRTAGSVSMFVKTLPVVCSIADRTKSPAAFANEVGEQIINSMSNDIFSFAEIKHEFDVRADILFIYQGDEFSFDTFCGKPADIRIIEVKDEKEPLLFQMFKEGGSYRYHVEYDSSRFSPEFIRYFTRSFDNAVEQFISCVSLEDIDLADEATMDLVRFVNSTDVPYDRENTPIHDFVTHAREDPDHLAVVCSGESITYGEMDRISDHIAAYIHSKGIGRDCFVGVLVPRSISMVTCAEGVLKSGAAYEPLDPSYPDERLMFMLEDSRAELLIADRGLLGKVSGFKGDILCLDEIPRLCSGERPDVSALAPSEKDAMIILYTSGTTGTPKGCVLEHGNLMSYLGWLRRQIGINAESVYASYASYGFDACMMDIHVSMTSGATMHIIPDDMRKDLAEIDRYYESNGITHGFMTTQMGRMFMETTKARSLKVFSAGGEALVPLIPPSWVDFYNIYGPTECTVNVTNYLVKDDSPLLPIGKPNSNVRVYVLDKQDRIVPVGSCGELCISGPQVFRGYLNNPDKTAMAIVRNPYADCPEHSRLYRTGDVVRLLPDGNIDYIGRRDGMVKIRGFRIELGEVEKAIRDHPAVTNATVTAMDDPAGGKSLVAYYVTDKGVSVQELKDFITKSKPPYMVPSYFVQMDSIPVNVNGKVDKRRLPAPSMNIERTGREPSGETETNLCRIFEKILGSGKVFADDDFFEIGGTSISASKLVMNCMNAGYPVVFRNVFDNPTPAKLAAFIATVKDSDSKEEERSKVDVGPLSHNVVGELGDMATSPIGKVLLTGATGFLGSHILRELLEKGTEQIICLVRAGKGQSSESRIKTVFKYYFGGLIDDDSFSRIVAVDSDITDPMLESRLEGLEFDTIINCAAIVKHFANDDSIERVNVGGVTNLIRIAKDRDCRFVQISTKSVAGESVNEHIPKEKLLTEDILDFGQNLENKYVNSKFKAEVEIIKAISEGLRAKIIRVGNLMSRDSDGEFQINSDTNAFMKQIKAYTKIGCYSVTELDAPVEFSPIDKVAEAAVLLSGTPDKYTVFHVDNCHRVHMYNVLKVLSMNGLDVDIVSPEKFREKFMEILADDTRNQYVAGLLSYLGNAGETRRFIEADNTFTVKALYMLGFSWPVIGEAYIDKAVRSLKALRFFR